MTATRQDAFWDVPFVVEVVPAQQDGSKRHLRVIWRYPEDQTEVEAVGIIEQSGTSVIVREFSVATAEGWSVPAAARRLPSDGAVALAIRSYGRSGSAALAWLLDEAAVVSALLPESLDRALTSAEVDTIMDKYGSSVVGRPRKRMSRQTVLVRDWLDSGISTHVIVDRLMAQGVSSSTAYRRLRQARALSSNG